MSLNEEKRWTDIDNLLLQPGAYTSEDFDHSKEFRDMVYENAKILVIGAGGLGCEILKDLALMGFRDIHVVDLDTIDITNLNRQFLFRQKDVGNYKSEVAAKFIEKRVPGCKVTPYKTKIQDIEKEQPGFYEQFQIIVAGLDNVDARRWLNQKVHSMVEWEGDQPKGETIRILIDGGTEGFRGQARVIIPFQSACFECTLGTIPKGNMYNFCTIAKTPRIAEHCIAYAQLILWEEQFPTKKIDTDSFDDMNWIYEQALKRAEEFGIKGVTFKLTQGVVKNIIPAIASTNALISAACCAEAFKILTTSSLVVDNYMMYIGDEGVHTNTMKMEPNEDCPVCVGLRPKQINKSKTLTLGQFLDELKEEPYLIKDPSVNSTSGPLYIGNKAFAHMYAANLQKTLEELREKGGTEKLELHVQDPNHTVAKRFLIVLE